MSSEDVHTGFWRDWRSNSVVNHRLTLSGTASNALVAVIGIWVGSFISAWFWSVLVDIFHAWRAPIAQDGVRAQHQIVWQNDRDPLTAFKDNLRILVVNWSPDPTSASSLRNMGNRTSNTRIRVRTAIAALSPLAVWAAFLVAAILAPRVADPRGDVLLSVKPGRCGIIRYLESSNDSQKVYSVYAAKVLNDTLSARTYAQNCYAREFDSLRSSACNFYTVPSLPYDTRTVGSCPFSPDSSQPFNDSPCAAAPSEYQNSSYHLFTHLLDSSTHLGINAPPQDRILIQKNLTCSPLSLTNRSRPIPALGTIANVTYTGYFFGMTEASTPSGETYFHNSNANMDYVPYTVQ